MSSDLNRLRHAASGAGFRVTLDHVTSLDALAEPIDDPLDGSLEGPLEGHPETDDSLVWRRRARDIDPSRRRKRAPLFRDSTEEALGRIASESLAEAAESGLPMTYRPARFETVWLASSLRSFYDQELIVDVLAQVKGGKEANVYRCRAHPRAGGGLVAAKVYRPRRLRNLANDRLYREGRPVLTADGRPVKTTDHRILRAIGKKTAFGLEVKHTSWLMYEYATLEQLHRAGGAVPEPLGANENAILMGYRGDEREAAPTLQEVSLGRREARSLFAEALRNVELLLSLGLVHGDLSAYNILYWEGAITLIDFPQVTSVHGNPSARTILDRDLRRVGEYFARQGVRSDSARLAADLWERYGAKDYPEPQLDPDSLEEVDEDDED